MPNQELTTYRCTDVRCRRVFMARGVVYKTCPLPGCGYPVEEVDERETSPLRAEGARMRIRQAKWN